MNRLRRPPGESPRLSFPSSSLGTPFHEAPLRPNIARTRPGHTLVEILLALGLSLVILTAVYAALDQHWRYAEAGQRQTEQMQVTRALFERVALDLRSVVFRPRGRFDQPAGSSNDRRIEIIQADEFYLRGSLGIVGDSETLVVQVNAPRVDGSLTSRRVRWEMQPANSRREQPQVAPQRDDVGLARIEIRPARRSESASGLPESIPQDLLAMEVKRVAFRYFARGQWFARWDSVLQGELPQAVEVTIAFGELAAADRNERETSSSAEYQLIIPVPAGEA